MLYILEGTTTQTPSSRPTSTMQSASFLDLAAGSNKKDADKEGDKEGDKQTETEAEKEQEPGKKDSSDTDIFSKSTQ